SLKVVRSAVATDRAPRVIGERGEAAKVGDRGRVDVEAHQRPARERERHAGIARPPDMDLRATWDLNPARDRFGRYDGSFVALAPVVPSGTAGWPRQRPRKTGGGDSGSLNEPAPADPGRTLGLRVHDSLLSLERW